MLTRLQYYVNDLLALAQQTVPACKPLLDIVASYETFLCLGVGKSALLAQKMAGMFLSCGIDAHAPSVESLEHGGMRLLSFPKEPTCLFFFSKSGETPSLVSLVPYVHEKTAQILFTAATIEKVRYSFPFAHVISLPVWKEHDVFSCVPTRSAVSMLVLADLFAMEIIARHKKTYTDLATAHPGGTIGIQSASVDDTQLLYE